MTDAALRARHLTGILLAIAAVVAFSVLDSFAKHLSQSYPLPMVIWARYFVHVLVMLALLAPGMGTRLVQTRRPAMQIARGILLGMSTVFFVTGLSMMPIAEASTIALIAPVLVALLAVRFLGERAPAGTWWALAVSFAGVLLIVRPGGQVFGVAALLPMGSALCFAVYQLFTRRLAGVDDGLSTLFIGALVPAIIGSFIVPWFWQMPESLFDAGLFVGMGCFGAFSHLLLVRALERAPASMISPFAYLQVVSALVVGWLFFGDFPDLMALAGMGLIVITGVTLALRKRHVAGPGARSAAPSAAAVSGQAPLKAILLAVGAFVLFSLLDSLVKLLTQTHHPLMIAWARYVFHVVIMVAVFAPVMGRALFITRSPRLQIARGVCLGLSSICFFTSVAYLPLAEATAIAAISPVLVTAGAVWWLKERTPPGTWWALAASFTGVLLIVRPGTELFGWPALLPLLTAFLGMGYSLLTRQLSGVDNGLTTLFIGAAVAALLLSVFAPGAWSMPTGPLEALMFMATGVVGALGHLMLVRAYETASASSLAPFGYAHAAAALVFGLVIFGQFPDNLALLGLGLIVLSGLAVAFRNRGPARLVQE